MSNHVDAAAVSHSGINGFPDKASLMAANASYSQFEDNFLLLFNKITKYKLSLHGSMYLIFIIIFIKLRIAVPMHFFHFYGQWINSQR